MKHEEIKSAVAGVISEVFAEKKIEPGMIDTVDLVDDFGMESITFISLIMALETKFVIRIPDAMIKAENFQKIDDIVGIIECELTKQKEMLSDTRDGSLMDF
ncbi:MAG: acyl carrier protein [Firmicutes bacterium]|nr:acyl carrier protein [Bacillota bacterium]